MGLLFVVGIPTMLLAAKADTYQSKSSNLVDADKLLGSDSAASNATKNFPLSAIYEYIENKTPTVTAAEIAALSPTVTTATDYTLGTGSANEAYGGIVYVTGAATITIPAVAANMDFTIVTIGSVAVSLDVNVADRVILDGTALSDGDKVTNTSTTGDTLYCKADSAAGFFCWSGSPDGDHWTDGN